MSQYDYPNREVLGLDPPWIGGEGSEAPAPQQQAETPNLDEMTKDELLELARQRGVTPANAAMTKDEIRESIDNA